MSEKFVLKHTVHYGGRVYTAGTEADEIGEVATEFGQHVWEGGRGPAKTAKPDSEGGGSGDPGGSLAGSPPVPPPSALPTPPAPAELSAPAADEPDADAGSASRRPSGGRRSGS